MKCINNNETEIKRQNLHDIIELSTKIDSARTGCRLCTAYKSWIEITSRYNKKDTE